MDKLEADLEEISLRNSRNVVTDQEAWGEVREKTKKGKTRRKDEHLVQIISAQGKKFT